MEKIIASGKILTDRRTKNLIDHIDKNNVDLGLEQGVLYYNFPIFQDYEDDIFIAQILILSPNHGVIIVSLDHDEIAGDINDYINAEEESIEHYYGLIYSRLFQSKILKKGRKLLFNINSILVNTSINDIDADKIESESYICTSYESLFKAIKDAKLDVPLSEIVISESRSIIEGAKALTKKSSPRLRDEEENTKAYILKKLEDEIANFDESQRKTAITLLDGPQRIRGLAGSGKTIVLAMKAAQLHLSDPTKKILFTFYTKSLIDFIKNTISRFYRHFKGKDPDWNNLHVMHAWGGRWIDGVYYNACSDNGIPATTYAEVPKNISNKFDYVCGNLVSNSYIKEKYDYILIDEAQDFPTNFFKLCFFLCKGDRDRKSIVWAYDELQNIFKIKRKTAKDFFGVDDIGEDLINLQRSSAAIGIPPYMSNDTVLHKCYRNPRLILLVAHALGFGLYGETVQALEDKNHWEDVGYKVIEGNFEIGSQIVVERPQENSPLSIDAYENQDELIKTFKADNISDEINWCVDEITQFIGQGLRPDDIMVISLDDRNAKSYFSAATSKLRERGILTNNLLSNPYGPSTFNMENHVTLSTVYRAKGNEMAVVIAVGIDGIYFNRQTRNGRNRLFTAFTRTKAWLRISGIGDNAGHFFDEIDKAKSDFPRLHFIQPDPKEVETIERDLSDRDKELSEALKALKAKGFSQEEIDSKISSLFE